MEREREWHRSLIRFPLPRCAHTARLPFLSSCSPTFLVVSAIIRKRSNKGVEGTTTTESTSATITDRRTRGDRTIGDNGFARAERREPTPYARFFRRRIDTAAYNVFTHRRTHIYIYIYIYIYIHIYTHLTSVSAIPIDLIVRNPRTLLHRTRESTPQPTQRLRVFYAPVSTRRRFR